MPLAKRHFWISHNSASLKEHLTSQEHVSQGGSLDGWVSGCRETNGFGFLWAWWSLSLPLVDGEPLVFSFENSSPSRTMRTFTECLPSALFHMLYRTSFSRKCSLSHLPLWEMLWERTDLTKVTNTLSDRSQKGTRVFGSHGACWNVDHLWCRVNRVYILRGSSKHSVTSVPEWRDLSGLSLSSLVKKKQKREEKQKLEKL